MDNRKQYFQLDENEQMQKELERIVADLLERKPHVVIVIARSKDDLIVRMTGQPAQLMELYASTPEIMVEALGGMVSISTGKQNG